MQNNVLARVAALPQMPMAELKAAYARMNSRQVRGKLVLVND